MIGKKEDALPMLKNWDNNPEVAKYTLWVEHENVKETKKLIFVCLPI